MRCWIDINVSVKAGAHGVTFTTARLTIRHNRCVVSLKKMLDNRLHLNLVDLFLVGGGGENVIKSKRSVLSDYDLRWFLRECE